MKTYLVALVVATLTSWTALAQTVPGEQLDALDADANAAVSVEEFRRVMDLAFDALDQNADGFLSRSEAEVTMTSELFGSADANGDEGISEAEYAAQVERDFDVADEDGDGVLD